MTRCSLPHTALHIRYSVTQTSPHGCPECICCLSIAKLLRHYEHFSIDRKRRLYRAITNLCSICLAVLTRPSHTLIRTKVALVPISYWLYLTLLTTINVRSLSNTWCSDSWDKLLRPQRRPRQYYTK